ncbi:MAG: hypothetical protein WA239_26305, partial [Candidatus Sulfotelmatobacter sp.]
MSFRGHRNGGVAAACTLAMAMSVAAWAQAAGQVNPPPTAQARNNAGPGRNPDDGLVIEPTELPDTYPRGPYQVV